MSLAVHRGLFISKPDLAVFCPQSCTPLLERAVGFVPFMGSANSQNQGPPSRKTGKAEGCTDPSALKPLTA
jgi:hypothetical protein